MARVLVLGSASKAMCAWAVGYQRSQEVPSAPCGTVTAHAGSAPGLSPGCKPCLEPRTMPLSIASWLLARCANKHAAFNRSKCNRFVSQCLGGTRSLRPRISTPPNAARVRRVGDHMVGSKRTNNHWHQMGAAFRGIPRGRTSPQRHRPHMPSSPPTPPTTPKQQPGTVAALTGQKIILSLSQSIRCN